MGGDVLFNRSLSLVIIESGFLVAIAITALLGNVSVLYVFFKTPRLRSVTSYYIITLAVSDVLMVVIVMPSTIATLICGCDSLGPVLGKISFSVFATLVFGSLQTTSLIALNRYFCIVKPDKYRAYFKPKYAIIMICVCWLVALCLVILLTTTNVAVITFLAKRAIYFSVVHNKNSARIFNLIYKVGFAIFPAVISSICYWRVNAVVKKHSELTASTSLSVEEIKITRSLVSMVIGFLFCWIPNAVVCNISQYMVLPRSVQLVVPFSVFLNSAVNPVLYNLFNKQFRRRFLVLMRPNVLPQ